MIMMRSSIISLVLAWTMLLDGVSFAAINSPVGKVQQTQRLPKFHKIPVSEALHHHHHAHLRQIVTLRGGDDEPPVTKVKPFESSITPALVAAYTGAALLAGMTVYLVRKIPRSGGHGQAWLTQFLAEPLATGALHLGYVLHCLIVVKIMPKGLRDVVFSPTGVVLLGTLFPVVESIRAAASDSAQDDRIWLQYWVMHGIFSYATEFIDKLAERFPGMHSNWYAFEFYATLWLILPMTDGAAVVYDLVTKPYIVPFVMPIKERCEGWLTTIALTLVNASYLWWFAVIFLALPNFIKRLAVIFTGTVFPVIGTVVAVSSSVDVDDMRWLTYWSCFSLLFMIMQTIEKFMGPFTGLYTITLASTLYLMLPVFDGSVAVFRQILVPLFGQQEALILKDAKLLAKELAKKLPAGRHSAARKAAAAAFLEQAGSA